MPKVSIVLPVYNGERYLDRSLESILKQTFDDWELIVVDDCSTDATPQIISKYVKKDKRIKSVRNSANQKLPKTLNIGFSVAKGTYLTWTSDDNMYLPTALMVMFNYLDSNRNVYMVRADMQIIDENGVFIENSEEYDDNKMYLRNCLGACFMYRKEVRETIGNYNEDAFGVEDYDYWLKILKKYGKIGTIHNTLYQYRRHEGSLSETKREYILDQLVSLRIRNIGDILEAFRGQDKILCQIYYEMLQSHVMNEEYIELFKCELPELRRDTIRYEANQKYIIFGAGIYGEKLASMLGEKALFFIDNDMKKIGTKRSGLVVVGVKSVANQLKKYNIIIAAAPTNIYEMIKQLYGEGIDKYGVYWTFAR